MLMNNGWKCLWRGHPVQPTDHLMPSRWWYGVRYCPSASPRGPHSPQGRHGALTASSPKPSLVNPSPPFLHHTIPLTFQQIARRLSGTPTSTSSRGLMSPRCMATPAPSPMKPLQSPPTTAAYNPVNPVTDLGSALVKNGISYTSPMMSPTHSRHHPWPAFETLQ